MPESPELRLSAEIIRPLVINKSIIKAYYTQNSRYYNSPNELGEFNLFNQSLPTTITSVHTKGKFMYWKFSNDFILFNHFGMTGQWSPKPSKHPCFVFEFQDSQIVFNDPRHFGSVYFTNNSQHLTDKLNELGWDPFSNKLDKYLPFLTSQIQKSNKPIAQILLDQSLFAGVGNYIRAEALYLAQISPFHLGKSLSKETISSLCQAIITVVNNSYNHQGATLHTYKDPYGNEGKYSSQFKVYSKSQDPLGNPVLTAKTPDKRTIHYVPNIQK